jgi:hypothetical protein
VPDKALSLARARARSLSLSLSFSLSLSLARSLARARSLSLALSLSLCLFVSLSLSLSRSPRSVSPLPPFVLSRSLSRYSSLFSSHSCSRLFLAPFYTSIAPNLSFCRNSPPSPPPPPLTLSHTQRPSRHQSHVTRIIEPLSKHCQNPPGMHSTYSLTPSLSHTLSRLPPSLSLSRPPPT